MWQRPFYFFKGFMSNAPYQEHSNLIVDQLEKQVRPFSALEGIYADSNTRK